MAGAEASPTNREARKFVIIGVGVLVLVAAVAGVTVWRVSSSSSSNGSTTAPLTSAAPAPTLPAQPSPTAYADLYNQAVVKKTTLKVLPKWPKPYEVYLDGTGEQCYEWFDRPSILYNLCFKNGVLADKSLA